MSRLIASMKVLRSGHPILRKKCKPFTVEEITQPKTRELVASMFKTMAEQGGLGLAAPQVGVEQQVIVLRGNRPDTGLPNLSEFPPKALFNPTLEPMLKHEVFKHTEMCLSVPGMAGIVTRFNNVLVHYFDEDGKKRRLAATGLIAALLQHEIDHLEGSLYLDKIETMKDFGFAQEMADHGKMIINDHGSIKFFER